MYNMKSIKIINGLIVVIILLYATTGSIAHPGRTDGSGGHNVRTAGWGYPVGSYHYHNGGGSYRAPRRSSRSQQRSSSRSSQRTTRTLSIDEAVKFQQKDIAAYLYIALDCEKCVKAMQRTLDDLHFKCVDDGSYGPKTKAALMEWGKLYVDSNAGKFEIKKVWDNGIHYLRIGVVLKRNADKGWIVLSHLEEFGKKIVSNLKKGL